MVAHVHEHRRRALASSSSVRRRSTTVSRPPRSYARRVPRAAAALYPGITLEFLPARGEISDERIDLMADMSLAANRPLNWNLLGSFSPTEVYEQQLTSCDRAAAKGATVVALTVPDMLKMRAGTILDDLPGWREVTALEGDARRAAIADPAVRARLRAGVEEAESRGLGALTKWDLLQIAEGDGVAGRTVAEVAAARQMDPVDVLIDVVLPDRLPITMMFPSLVPSLGIPMRGGSTCRRGLDPRTVLR
jgi:N-acyl-D-aspartate/D-glutamate deacylase